MKIVGIGGGTGLPVLLAGLKEARLRGDSDFSITALVAVSDSGGSTGRLRDTLGIPAVGDLRKCLLALSESPAVLKAVCEHRFENVGELTGHSAGNLLLSALYQMTGDFDGMVRLARHLLQLKDLVLPCTNFAVTLCAEYSDGKVVRNESDIPKYGRPIQRVWLEPDRPSPAAGVLDAIAGADAIVFGPGSLYTSVIPNLLVSDIADAIHASAALKIYVCNLMTQAGETEQYSAADHLKTLQRYLPQGTVDVCIVNTRAAHPLVAERYGVTGAHMVREAMDEIRRLGVTPEPLDLLQEDKGKIRHDGLKLAQRIVALAHGQRELEVLCAES